MEIRNLTTFIQVAERHSFTHAAEALGYTQSTVSAQIKQLETELDTQLFERVRHNVQLTERGQHLLKYARMILNLVDEMNLGTDGDDCAGLVRFAMAPSICNVMMGKTFMRFHEMYPNISVTILEGNTDDMLSMLDHNDVDLIFTVDRHVYNREYKVVSEKKVEMCFVAGKTLDLGGKSDFTIKELVEYPFVLTEKELSYRKMFDERLAAMSLEVKPMVEIGNTNLLLELIELGAGVSFLPRYVTEKAVDEGRIIRLNVSDFDVEIWRQILYRESKWVSPAMKRVMDYCSDISENSLW